MIREGGRPWISISHLSPCNSNKGLFIVLKAYFDVSGKVNVPQDRFITLAAMSARPWAWRVFEWRWRKALDRSGAPFSEYKSPLLRRKMRYFHTSEAIAHQGGFKDWDDKKLRPLINRLFNLMSHAARRPPLFAQPILSFVCTVDKKAFDLYATKKPNLPPLHRICLDHCLGHIKDDKRAQSGLELYWDRGDSKSEPYFQSTQKLIYTKTSDKPEWAKWVYHNTEVRDSKMVFPIQAVDFLAWSTNRYFANDPDYAWAYQFVAMAMGLNLIYAEYDYSAFDKVFDLDGNYRARAKIPQRPLRFPKDTILKRKEP